MKLNLPPYVMDHVTPGSPSLLGKSKSRIARMGLVGTYPLQLVENDAKRIVFKKIKWTISDVRANYGRIITIRDRFFHSQDQHCFMSTSNSYVLTNVSGIFFFRCRTFRSKKENPIRVKFPYVKNTFQSAENATIHKGRIGF
jgi:hypothetical protein